MTDELTEMEKRLQTLEDVESIKKLKARYWYCVDNKEWDGIAACYAEDAEFECPRLGKLEGGRIIAGVLRKVMKNIQTAHHGHCPEIEITGEGTATGRWTFNDYVKTKDNGFFRGYGYYKDEYIRVDGSWKIRSSRIRYLIEEDALTR